MLLVELLLLLRSTGLGRSGTEQLHKSSPGAMAMGFGRFDVDMCFAPQLRAQLARVLHAEVFLAF